MNIVEVTAPPGADRTGVIDNTVGLAESAAVFNVPIVLSAVAAESFSGPLMPQLAEVFPKKPIIGPHAAG